ncbi:MAG: hypothetical protein AAGJ81_05025 [Verrucomicrobiota bacterium]
MVDLGVAGANAFSLPKSVGSIFGLLFASPYPLGLDDLVQKLEISKGSASMGLNYLRKIGAIRDVDLPDSRRTTYEPELSLRRLLDGILQATILPHLKDSGERLDELQEALSAIEGEDRLILEKRLKTLRSWRKKGQTLAPVASQFLGRR